MPAAKTKADPLADIVGTFSQAVVPFDVQDLFEIMDRHENSGASEQFEILVDEELMQRRREDRNLLTSDSYLKAVDEIRAALPAHLQTLLARVENYETADESARSDVAFRLGIAIGKALAGGQQR